nr:unnamed protein product [Digitaria exilis]
MAAEAEGKSSNVALPRRHQLLDIIKRARFSLAACEEKTPAQSTATSKRLGGEEKQKLRVFLTVDRASGVPKAALITQKEQPGWAPAHLLPGTRSRWKFQRT